MTWLLPASSQATVTWPPGTPWSPDWPLSVGVRPWLTVIDDLVVALVGRAVAAPSPPGCVSLLTSAIVTGLKLLPPSDETSSLGPVRVEIRDRDRRVDVDARPGDVDVAREGIRLRDHAGRHGRQVVIHRHRGVDRLVIGDPRRTTDR